MQHTIKLSISLVTYNQPEFLIEAIESILTQQVNFQYEIVIGNDCSTDNTREILDGYAVKYPGKFKLIHHPVNVGPYQNFSDTVKACTGEYIAHLDGDDRMLPGKLQKQADFLDLHTDCAIVHHNLRIFNSADNLTTDIYDCKYRKPINIPDDLLMYGTFRFIGHSAKMYRRSSIPPAGFDMNGGDWLFHLENAVYGNIGYINEILGEYRVHTGGISRGRKGIRELYKRQIYTVEKAGTYSVYSDSAVRFARASVHYGYALTCIDARELTEFTSAIVQSAVDHVFIDDTHKFLFRYHRLGYVLYFVFKLKNKMKRLLTHA